jgi:S-formylglutathione hydrolase FrmB
MPHRQRVDRRATALTVASAALGIEKLCYAYVPPEAAQGQRLPALYLLRGHEREWVNPHEDDSRGGLTAIDVYERLRHTGAIGPLILVMPGLSSDDNAIPSALADFAAPERAAGQAGLGSGRFASYFFDDLIPFIDASLPTLPIRGITGFSLGGLMAVAAAARRPDLFVSVGAYDGTILYGADGGRRFRPTDRVLDPPMFDPVFGQPRDLDRIAEHSPIAAMQRADPAALRALTWLIQYGPEEIEPWGSNFYRGEHLLRAMRALGISNALPGPVPEGRHSWQHADQHLALTLPHHWAAMERRINRQ